MEGNFNESGRGNNGLFRDSLLWKATSKMASSWLSQRKWVAFLFLDLVQKKKKKNNETNYEKFCLMKSTILLSKGHILEIKINFIR